MRSKFIFESAVVLAVITGVLYSFGHYYNYQYRELFSLGTVALGASTESLIQDGLTVFIGWLGTTTEFWSFVVVLIVIGTISIFAYFKTKNPTFKNAIINTFIITCLLVFYSSVIIYITYDRAPSVAKKVFDRTDTKTRLVIVLKEAVKINHVSTNGYIPKDLNKKIYVGYIIKSTTSHVAFITLKKETYVFARSNIHSISSKYVNKEIRD